MLLVFRHSDFLSKQQSGAGRGTGLLLFFCVGTTIRGRYGAEAERGLTVLTVLAPEAVVRLGGQGCRCGCKPLLRRRFAPAIRPERPHRPLELLLELGVVLLRDSGVGGPVEASSYFTLPSG
jgi:hypothetical protein